MSHCSFDFQKYLSDFKSHDLASLERFKNLTEGDLDSLEITNLEHRVKLLTVAKLLLEPIKGEWCVCVIYFKNLDMIIYV